MISWSSSRPLSRADMMFPQLDGENLKAQTEGHLSRSPASCPNEIHMPWQNVGLLPRKIFSFLRPVKDDLGLRTPGVYSTPVSVARCTLDSLADQLRPE